MPLTYKEVEKRYVSNSINVLLNSVRIGEIYYDAMNSKGESKPWRAEMKLPGFKHKTIKVSGVEEAKAHIEKCFKTWLEWTGLTETVK